MRNNQQVYVCVCVCVCVYIYIYIHMYKFIVISLASYMFRPPIVAIFREVCFEGYTTSSEDLHL